MKNENIHHYFVNDAVDLLTQVTEDDDGTLTVASRPVYTGTATPVWKKPPYRESTNNKDKVPILIHQMLSTARKDCRHIQRKAYEPTSQVSTVPLGDRLMECVDEMEKANITIIGSQSTWADSTTEAAWKYFKNNLLPVLADILNNGDFNQKDHETLKALIAEKAEKRIKALQPEISEEALKRKTDQRIVSHMNTSSYVYNAIRLAFPGEFPVLPLRMVKSKTTRFVNEQLRVIPLDILAGLVCILEASVEAHPREVMAIVLSLAGGCRIGESCGTLPCDFIYHKDGYSIVRILHQEKMGKRIDRLKKDQCKRLIIICKWGTEVIKRCIKFLGDHPELDNPDSKIPLIRKERVSAFLDTAFENAGLDVERLDRIVEETRGYKCNSVEDKATSHLLRRNFTNMIVNICGQSLDTADALLGHKRAKSKVFRPDMKDEAELAKIALALERVVFSTSCTRNPAYQPITLTPGEEMEAPPFERSRIRNDGTAPIKVILDLDANTLGAGITITSKNIVKFKTASRIDRDNVCLHKEKYTEMIILDKAGDEYGRS